ncbi:hypothetical protein KDX27_41325 [Burkholderia cenocepacia]|uniref:hypothetical protein n=1 Tax=Burkholderia cenocepacia TaxID=95486 RepID=UPI001B92BEE6|nr:hypothetical protein [Burkholderia cenocepacia]MBR8030097.1 hypothetical protein [Burkholderia cenocepacia]MBR8174113.1 hypothetical protein [Burkholderia cenocepacia]
MGRREDINKELDQLAIEIEKDAVLARYEHAAKNRPALETHLLLDIVIPQNAQTRLQIRISTQPVDDGETS